MNRTARGGALALALLAAPVFCPIGYAQTAEPGIVEVVRGVYMAGVPYETAILLSQGDRAKEDRDILLKMIQQEDEAPYWPNATKLLGIIGGEDMYVPLRRLIEGREDKFSKTSAAVYRGRLSAVVALGYLADERHAGSDDAMEYLKDSVRPSAWRGRDLPWIQYNRDAALNLSLSAVHGLFVSGRPEVIEIMKGLASDEAEGDSSRIRTANAARSVIASLTEGR